MTSGASGPCEPNEIPAVLDATGPTRAMSLCGMRSPQVPVLDWLSDRVSNRSASKADHFARAFSNARRADLQVRRAKASLKACTTSISAMDEEMGLTDQFYWRT
jgi:hypothetical protein